MKRILILGDQGMAGHLLLLYIKETKKYRVFSTNHSGKNGSIRFDALDPKAIIKIIKSVKPEIIINCIGLLVKESQERPADAIIINSFFPRFLESICEEYGFKLIHLSTNCVFSGKKGNYSEDSLRDGDSPYERTKALGEILENKNCITIRTSIIGPEISKEPKGLMDWFLSQKKEINGYAKVFWTGITTLELAKVIETLISRENESTNEPISGAIHVVPSKKTTKYSLLKLIADVFKKDIVIRRDLSKTLNQTLKQTKKTELKIPDYRTMIVELKDWIKKHKSVYAHKDYYYYPMD